MTQATETTHDVVKASEVTGVDVENTQGENLGEISEIVLDKLSGEARYVVLSFGGIFTSDKLFALPWKSISYDEDKDCFILNINKETLKNAPGFDKNHWPNFSDKTWGAEIHRYYGQKPYWE